MRVLWGGRGPHRAWEAWRDAPGTWEALTGPGGRVPGQPRRQGGGRPAGGQRRSEDAAPGAPCTGGRGGQAYGACPGNSARPCRSGRPCPPPCRAEPRRQPGPRARGAAISPGGATRTASSRAGAPAARRPPPAGSRAVPRPLPSPWRRLSPPWLRACSSHGPAPHAAAAPLGLQGTVRRVLGASPPSQPRSGPWPWHASWKPSTRRTACAVARATARRGEPWTPWPP